MTIPEPTKDAALLPLRCLYCGDEITPVLEYTASYSEHRDHTGYECDNYRCDARWDKRGNPTEQPRAAAAPAPTEEDRP